MFVENDLGGAIAGFVKGLVSVLDETGKISDPEVHPNIGKASDIGILAGSLVFRYFTKSGTKYRVWADGAGTYAIGNMVNELVKRNLKTVLGRRATAVASKAYVPPLTSTPTVKPRPEKVSVGGVKETEELRPITVEA